MLVVDGDRVPLEGGPGAGNRVVQVKMPIELLNRLSKAERVAGRLCEDRWRLSPRSQSIVKEFAAQLNEERLMKN
ncbi:hypothetical protein [Sorangium sp. So ce388]|uniref:hypothetical protein n=1 Tax=Sorangium sp. So ce388 TaxID=3133309 RepID=UPI003F5B5B40